MPTRLITGKQAFDEKETSWCPVCKQVKVKKAFLKILNKKITINCRCLCDKEKDERREKEIKNQRNLKKINELKSISLLSKRYENACFNNTKLTGNKEFEMAFNRCKNYALKRKEVLEKGFGIYLYGSPGTGKTHLSACIANEFLKNFVPVLFTNLFEISKTVRSSYKKNSNEIEKDLILKFGGVRVLFFDDLGTEVFKKNESDTWLQTLVFDLINKRYNARLPTCFSSNHSINDLVNKCYLLEKTADRIYEMTKGAVMKISGKSFRTLPKGDLPF